MTWNKGSRLEVNVQREDMVLAQAGKAFCGRIVSDWITEYPMHRMRRKV